MYEYTGPSEKRRHSSNVAWRLRQTSQMRHHKKAYHSLDELYQERDAIQWYWRLTALVASWMILGGFLIFPSTFDTDPELRFSKSVLAVIIVILLTCGFSLTALLWFLVPSWLFQSENIFYPALCSSALGLLGTLYAFVSSPRYSFTGAAGVAVALTSSSTAIYAVLLVWVQRKIARVRNFTTVYQAAHVEIPRDGRESQASTAALTRNPSTPGLTTGLWGDASYYRNYVQNQFPMAVRNPSLNTRHSHGSFHSLQNRSPSPPLQGQSQTYYDPTSSGNTHYDPAASAPRDTTALNTNTYNGMTAASTPATPFFPITEDDMVNQQMARLLLQERDRAGNDQQSTFRIQWPTDDDDEADPAQRGIRMRTRTGSGSRLIPPNRLGAALSAAQAAQGIRPAQTTAGTGAEASRAARLSPFRGGDSARATDVEVERGRAEAQLTGVPRSKSREDRRKEIEMGNMEGTVNRSWR